MLTQHVGKSPTVRDVLRRCHTFYLPHYLKCDQSSIVRSFCANGHHQSRGERSFRLAGMFVLRVALPQSVHSWARSDQRPRVMRRLEFGDLSRPAPFSTSTHRLTHIQVEYSHGILPSFYHLGCFMFRVGARHRPPMREI